MGLPAEQELPCRLHDNDRYEDAGNTWIAHFVKAGSLLSHPETGHKFLVCGLVGAVAHIGWPVEIVDTPTKRELVFPSQQGGRSFEYVFILGWDDWLVEGIEAISPSRSFCESGFKLHKHLGVSWRSTGTKLSNLQHAASMGFWNLSYDMLCRACRSLDVAPEEPTLVCTIVALVQKAYPKI